ncbi:hypothetical protein [Mycobacterium sp. NPDC050853]|uniref:hypothetical protein n=1 Tax=Mycobacteriaceae TaxID=1762 RepID=UPI0015DDEAA6|nr:hypothetical protein [Mycobacteroides sp. LB1]
MTVRSIPFHDSVSVGTLVRAAALFDGRRPGVPANSASGCVLNAVPASHLLDAISHSDKHIGDLYAVGL